MSQQPRRDEYLLAVFRGGVWKSTNAAELVERLPTGQRGAFVFFDRNFPAHNDPNGVIRTLPCQFAFSNGAPMGSICNAIEWDPQISTRPLESRFKALESDCVRGTASRVESEQLNSALNSVDGSTFRTRAVVSNRLAGPSNTCP